MAKRKTVDVQFVLEKANHFFLHSANELAEQRLGVAGFLETILFETDNYKGFGYLTAHDMVNSENGTTYGIIFDNVNGGHTYPDPSLVKYF